MSHLAGWSKQMSALQTIKVCSSSRSFSRPFSGLTRSASRPRLAKPAQESPLRGSPLVPRSSFSSSTGPDLSSLCHLSDRAVLRVSGGEAADFLQGLITNDVDHLTQEEEEEEEEKEGKTCMYTMMLNTQGRVLFDALVFRSNGEEFWIDCHSESVEKIAKHLRMYRVRRKVEIDLQEDWAVVAGLQDTETLSTPSIASTADPRSALLGFRHLVQKESLSKLQLETSNAYLHRRYELGISEGPEELPPTKCFPLESNADYLHGVSFHKGCYIGQELTARTHYTGVVRKRIMPLVLESGRDEVDLNSGIFTEKEKKVGQIRGQVESHLLAVMRVEEAQSAAQLVTGDGKAVKLMKPSWWPQIMPKKKGGTE